MIHLKIIYKLKLLYYRLLAILSYKKIKRKYWHELSYWLKRKAEEGKLDNEHFKYFYTDHFEIDISRYTDTKILDIGCGPRGSLEWAYMASELVGIDPLSKMYLKLGADKHKMIYIEGQSENIPYPQGYFDFVSSFNSLDHVNDLNKSIRNIKRVTKKGGMFLLITEINHPPRICEPISFSAINVIERFKPEFQLMSARVNEKIGGLYESAVKGPILKISTNKISFLSAKFQRSLED